MEDPRNSRWQEAPVARNNPARFAGPGGGGMPRYGQSAPLDDGEMMVGQAFLPVANLHDPRARRSSSGERRAFAVSRRTGAASRYNGRFPPVTPEPRAGRKLPNCLGVALVCGRRQRFLAGCGKSRGVFKSYPCRLRNRRQVLCRLVYLMKLIKGPNHGRDRTATSRKTA